MRKGFMLIEGVVAIGIITIIMGGALVMSASLIRHNARVRLNGVAVHELANVVERLRADPGLAPQPGSARRVALSPEVAARYEGLSLTLSSRTVPGRDDLLLVRAETVTKGEFGPPRKSAVEMYVRRKKVGS